MIILNNFEADPVSFGVANRATVGCGAAALVALLQTNIGITNLPRLHPWERKSADTKLTVAQHVAAFPRPALDVEGNRRYHQQGTLQNPARSTAIAVNTAGQYSCYDAVDLYCLMAETVCDARYYILLLDDAELKIFFIIKFHVICAECEVVTFASDTQGPLCTHTAP